MEYDGKLQEVDGNQQRKWQVSESPNMIKIYFQ